ncbi:UDP-2,4-diacetamido-2,4,6-trideoxy-beta-L-altropyranose hydrolase [Psychrobacter sp. DAB_AL62B]|uniref:UDP-2,4-diacetamido-2,4, 6-trideoxy-beta-L-altropyranose hydrolase n=1 Tax=Psychrobacter sp. DAB_AL62B TaxID=1028420 RepID=UPI002380E17C|nr:UDP-2,4-diacetamido-2,4,6-trideoxy-beta-L-altropyranose hydrolase [Psychrobacter sp. DAB_AL62B]MDE4455119.1 UDP-2,4-diacetamido-2,4,6-trideoxy-beta-L-altropyranose hydrolase [Psychrobacter sp. DAB_AL62B]
MKPLTIKEPSCKIVFRCDASIQIGTGHVMRCLTLANEMAQQGAECVFICRRHHGNLIKEIQKHGHKVYPLPLENDLYIETNNKTALAHADWLASTQCRDAELSRSIVKALQPDWLIVDHYALDENWEKRLQPYCKKLMVIDDLADRKHSCDVLLDQNFGRDLQDYAAYVNEDCELLCGSIYALLRPEFAEWRSYSLEQRQHNKLASILINLGGVDKGNITTKILKVLQTKSLPDHCSITIVMGSTSPWIEAVEQQAAIMRWRTVVKVGVDNMAELMANSDLAIGAAGSTSWERCCLGLPTIMLVLADNQQVIANVLEGVGAALTFDIAMLEAEPLESVAPKMRGMSKAASAVTDGLGATRLSKILLQ